MAGKVVNIAVIQRNLPFLRQNIVASFKGSSSVVQGICLTVILSYILSYSSTAVRVLSVTPGFLTPPNFWVWTAFTYCFLETKLLLLLADIITVGFCGKLLEPLWGTVEMLTFFALVNISVAFLSVLFYIIIYTITSDPLYLFSTHIHGLAGYCAGVAVAVKQIMPDHVLISSPVGKLKNKNVPLAVFILSLILWPVGIIASTYPVMFCSGLISSWTYLRFYQRHSNGTVGDMADSFSFMSFFPSIMQAPVNAACNTVFGRMLYAKLCKRNKRRYDASSTTTSLNTTIPGSDSHDAERRRQIALRALSERLNKVEQTTWPLNVDSREVKPVDKSNPVALSIPSEDHQSEDPKSVSVKSNETVVSIVTTS